MQVQIPGYQIKEVLGKGGMATVYLAVQEIFEREVALKVMSPSLAEDPSFGQRFLREARIVSQLVHPNIVTVFDVGVHNDLYYLSMEYIAGPDLKQACTQLTLPQKLNIIEDVASALDFAGSKGYIHRDIKPENILLRDGSGRAVLMDFGIARAAETDLCVTQTGTSLGTPHYMSPEQAKGQAVDHRSDLYSLGVVLYFLLMEQVPFHADSAIAIGIKHITEPVPVLPGYLYLLNPFIAKLMAKQPAQRYQQASDFIADLKRLDRKKLLKQYAQKAKYKEPPKAAAFNAQPTVVHHASTRLDRAIKTPIPAQSSNKVGLWVNQRRWPIAVASVSIFAAVALANGLASRERAPAPSVHVGAPPSQQEVAEEQRAAETSARTSAGALPRSIGNTSPAALPPETSSNSALADKIGSGLSGFAQRLSRQQTDLAEQVRHLRDEMRNRSDDARLRQKLNALAQTQFDAVDKLLDRGEYERAHTQLASLENLFPDYPAELGVVEQRLQQSDLLRTYAQKAQQRMEQGQYLEPVDDSAEHYYIEMLKLSPDLASAHQGLVEMAKRTIAKANDDFLAGDWEAAQKVVERLLALDPNHRASLALQEKIQRFRQHETTIQQHLSRAQGHLSAGNLYSPKDENAYAYFQKVLVLQQQHRAALEGLERTHQALEEILFTMVNRGDAALAQETLANVQQIRGNDRRLKQLRTELNELVEQHQFQQTPAIKRLIVAAQPLHELDTQQDTALALDRTLYVGMEYQAFNAPNTQVQAVLYGPEGLAQAHVPVVLDQPQGTHFFRVDRPQKAFADGDYQLKLLLEGRTLSETAFRVR